MRMMLLWDGTVTPESDITELCGDGGAEVTLTSENRAAVPGGGGAAAAAELGSAASQTREPLIVRGLAACRS